MQKALMRCFFLIIGISLTACSTNPPSQNRETFNQPFRVEAPATPASPAGPPKDQNTLHEVSLGSAPTSGALMGGSIEKAMDATDKLKMSRALDKAPGRATEWENRQTGISYSVTPIKKVIIKENPFCREYETIATKGDASHQITGTACIASDGNWHTISRT